MEDAFETESIDEEPMDSSRDSKRTQNEANADNFFGYKEPIKSISPALDSPKKVLQVNE